MKVGMETADYTWRFRRLQLHTTLGYIRLVRVEEKDDEMTAIPSCLLYLLGSLYGENFVCAPGLSDSQSVEIALFRLSLIRLGLIQQHDADNYPLIKKDATSFRGLSCSDVIVYLHPALND